MKKYLFGMIMAVLVLSCIFSVVGAEDIKTIKVADFEDSSVNITTYMDNATKYKATYATDIFQEGKQSVLIEAKTSSWAGCVLSLEGEKADWTSMTTFKMWVYGADSKKRFDFQLEDKDGELFLRNIKDDFTGWKQFVLKLDEIKQRTDYQDSKAKKNKVIDYPLKAIQFCSTNSVSGGSGELKLYFDNFEVTNE